MNDPVAWTLVSIPVAIVLYVWIGASLSAVFRKAGEEGWQAWVPVLNAIVLLRLGGLSPWLLLLALVPILGAVALLGVFIVVFHRVNRAFGAGVGMTVLAVLLFPVWTSVLGWGPARWLGDRGAAHRRPDAARRRGRPRCARDRPVGRVAALLLAGVQPGALRRRRRPLQRACRSNDPAAPTTPRTVPSRSCRRARPPRPPREARSGDARAMQPLPRPTAAAAEQWSFAPPPVGRARQRPAADADASAPPPSA